ncbi:hypothetical protein [Levilinea saccharolytica]|uniref:Uncharacterized protein n=1 Tax=Levilinea saccharolytica TaxID=229921 RepID=A0A0P6XM82_9CHLR|nr:hypothetical protein [Levilinea saccharolytica]KPL77464.1 hypothetical protein ADN01_16380 [Levilinea saccharolytica]GAP18836.1 hypothetical protein LSAC_02734 [Levilinea saccharolytica]
MKAKSSEPEPQSTPDQPAVYEIRIMGHLDSQWADWLGGLTLTLDQDDTLITAVVADQAALFGLLRKVRDSGLPLRSVNRMAAPADRPEDPIE